MEFDTSHLESSAPVKRGRGRPKGALNKKTRMLNLDNNNGLEAAVDASSVIPNSIVNYGIPRTYRKILEKPKMDKNKLQTYMVKVLLPCGGIVFRPVEADSEDKVHDVYNYFYGASSFEILDFQLDKKSF